MTQLKPTNLYAVIVPEDAGDFILWYGVIEPSITYGEPRPGGRIPLPLLSGKYDLLGTVTKDEITFDFESYLWSDKAEGMFYKYGNGSYHLKDRQNAFYHLLSENGFSFKNPSNASGPHQCPVCSWHCTCADYPCSCCNPNAVKKLLILKII